jgi:catechol 2,3-dioxygenase-like lactoylglutathione lyase family enzyme
MKNAREIFNGNQYSGGSMQLTSVAHTGFTVQDLERSLAFYRDLLGMQVIEQRETSAAYVGQVTGFAGAKLKIALLKLRPEDLHTLELLQYVSHPGEPTDRATNRPGNGHLALRVDDLQAWYRRLAAAGVEFRSAAPVPITDGANAGASAVYLRDPDGFTIELVQPAQRG